MIFWFIIGIIKVRVSQNHHDNKLIVEVAWNPQLQINVHIINEAFLSKWFALCFSWCHSIVMPPPTPFLLWLYSGECEGGAETERGAEGSSGSHRGADCLPRWTDCHWPGGTGTAYQRQCSKWHQWVFICYAYRYLYSGNTGTLSPNRCSIKHLPILLVFIYLLNINLYIISVGQRCFLRSFPEVQQNGDAIHENGDSSSSSSRAANR